MEVQPTKPELGNSQYLAVCWHVKLTGSLQLKGDNEDFGHTAEAYKRLAYGRLAVEVAGGNPDNLIVCATQSYKGKLTYRLCDDPYRKIVLVRIDRKPILNIVGWSTGEYVRYYGQQTEVRGLGCMLPAFTLEDHQIFAVRDLNDLR